MTLVSDFFDAYRRRRRAKWGGDLDATALGREEPSAQELYQAQSLRPPAVDRVRVAATLAAAGFDPERSADFCDFVSAWSCDDLDCEAWMAFVGSRSADGWARSSSALRAGVDAARFFPIGIDVGSGGHAVFCLDRRTPGSDPVVSLVDDGRVIERVYSDFGALLRVLTHLLDSEVVLCVERGAEPDAAQRALVDALRALDPEGFGAIGWPQWYQRLVGGTGWDTPSTATRRSEI